MKARYFVVLAAAAALVPSPALAWGKTGHRVVAAIADTQLSGLARAQVEQILGPGESLDEAANWPDEMRSAPGAFWQKTATPWHYVTLNGIIYDHAPPEGDALEALARFSKTLNCASDSPTISPIWPATNSARSGKPTGTVRPRLATICAI